MTLTEMRNRLRIDLHDERLPPTISGPTPSWTATLAAPSANSARSSPSQTWQPIQTGSDGRSVPLATLTDLVRVEAVEFPINENSLPPTWTTASGAPP